MILDEFLFLPQRHMAGFIFFTALGRVLVSRYKLAAVSQGTDAEAEPCLRKMTDRFSASIFQQISDR